MVIDIIEDSKEDSKLIKKQKTISDKKIKNKSINKSKGKSKNNYNYNKDLIMLLKEADNITLNDLEFDNILKEQSKILCNINTILNIENNKGNKDIINKNPVCDISKLNKDTKFKKLLSNFTIKNNNTKSMNIKTKAKSIVKYVKNINQLSKKKSNSKSINKFTIKSKVKSKQNTKKNCKKNLNNKPIIINKLTSKKKYIYKHDNKRKYDITITKPNIFIKGKD